MYYFRLRSPALLGVPSGAAHRRLGRGGEARLGRQPDVLALHPRGEGEGGDGDGNGEGQAARGDNGGVGCVPAPGRQEGGLACKQGTDGFTQFPDSTRTGILSY
jgi:hypothetical protein